MVRNRKKSTDRVHSVENIRKAVEAIRKGTTLRSAGKQFNVNYETLRRYCQKADQCKSLGDLDFVYQQNYNARQVFTKHEEQKLVEYFLRSAELGHGLCSEKARELSYEFAVRNNKKFPKSWSENKKAGIDWLIDFKKRHPIISLRKPEACSLARSSAFNKHNVSQYFNNLETVLKRNPNFANGLRVFNLDETGTSTVQSVKTKILSTKGQKRVSIKTSGERGTLVTTCVFVSAMGQLFPPAMVFPRKNFAQHMLAGCYPGTLGLAYPSGWMEQKNFLEVLKRFIVLTNCSKENEALLLMDNHDSHISLEAIDLCKANGITILTLHPHTSHMCQPLDRTCFGPFSTAYEKAMNAWMVANPGKPVSIYDIAGLVKEALTNSITPEQIRAGFKACGIFPFNPQVFTDKDFKLSEETDRDLPPADTIASGPNEQAAVIDGLNEGVDNEMDDHRAVEASGSVATLSARPDSGHSRQIITPEEIAPYPKAGPRKEGRRGRKRGKTMIATDTPVRNEIAAEKANKTGSKSNANPRSKSVQAVSKKLFQKKNSKSTPTEESDSTDVDDVMSLHNSSSDELSDNDSETETLPKPNPNDKVTRNPNEGEFVLVKFLSKPTKKGKGKAHQPKFYVGKIIKEIDNDGDCEISYLRVSPKCSGKFLLPNVPDLNSVHISDIVMILPNPSVSGTKRQQNQYSFAVDFSLLSLG